MDWKTIGKSYQPAIEYKESKSPPRIKYDPFESYNDKPPKYSRLQYIVGIDDELQEELLDKLEDGHYKKKKISNDKDNNINRYYNIEYNNIISYDYRNSNINIGFNIPIDIKLNHIIGRRYGIDIFKYIERSPTISNIYIWDSPYIYDWLYYINYKTYELMNIIYNNNNLDIPEWLLLRKLNNNELYKLYIQIIEILQKFSNNINFNNIKWYNNTINTSLSYYFIIILYYKLLIINKFNILLDTTKWLLCWSNDYLNINNIQFNININIHEIISIEPCFWQFISSLLLKSNYNLKWFNKILLFYFNYLYNKLLININNHNIQLSLLILLTECYLPRMIEMGYNNIAINTIRYFYHINHLNKLHPSIIFNLYSPQITKFINNHTLNIILSKIITLLSIEFKYPPPEVQSNPLEVQSNSVPLGVEPSSNYLSLKSKATPGDRGEDSDGSSIMGMMEDGAKDVLNVTSSGIPGSDLRELEGEVNRRGTTPSGRPQVESSLQDKVKTTNGVNSEEQEMSTRKNKDVQPLRTGILPGGTKTVNPEERETTDIISSGLPAADLREAEGEVIKRAVCKTTSGGMPSGNDKTSSGESSDMDDNMIYNSLIPEWDSVIMSGVKFNDVVWREFVFRVLELYGCKSIIRLSSNDRWYNFIKSTVIETKESKIILIIMLFFSMLNLNVEYASLLMEACNDDEISKLIIKLFYNEPKIWEKYTLIITNNNYQKSKSTLDEIINTLPNYTPILGIYLFQSIINDDHTQVCLYQ